MKTRIVFVALAGLILLSVSKPASGGGEGMEPPKPGPEHKMLAGMAGKWKAVGKAWFGPGEPKESSGMMDRHMFMKGLYMREKFDGQFAGMKFKGEGVMGFDTKKKKYVMAWVDNFGTGITLNYGTYDNDNRTLTFLGEEDNPMGEGRLKTKDVLKIISSEEQQFEMFRAPADNPGKEFKVMEIKYTRVKKVKSE